MLLDQVVILSYDEGNRIAPKRKGVLPDVDGKAPSIYIRLSAPVATGVGAYENSAQ